MQHMQVVVEKQETEERRVFDDRRPFLVMAGITMFRIGAKPGQCGTDIDEADEIEPERHAADRDDPGEHDGDACPVREPDPCPLPVTPHDQHQFLCEEAQDHDQRPERQPTEQSRVPLCKLPPHLAHAFPGGPGEIGGLRILDRIRQVFVAMVDEVAFQIDRIG
ncbi:hypothetical protein D9M70_530490 [compost metagenome]